MSVVVVQGNVYMALGSFRGLDHSLLAYSRWIDGDNDDTGSHEASVGQKAWDG